MIITILRRIISFIRNWRLFFKYKKFLGKKINVSDTSHKIILISHQSGESGAVVLLMEIIKEFHRKNYEIIVLSKNYGPLVEKASEYAYVEVFSNMWKFKRIIKHAYKNNYRKVICNTVVTGNLTPFLKKQNIKIISLVHELPNIIKQLNVEKNAMLLAQSSDVVVFPSNYVLNKYPYRDFIEGKSIVRPQGVNYVTDSIPNKNKAKDRLFDLFSIPPLNDIVLGVGSGDERKGFDLFLDLAQKSDNSKVSFVWVGSYSKKIYDRQFSAYNVNKLENLFLVGFVENMDILNMFYAAAHVFALTSREDPFPSVVLQAFNSRLPVVAFRDAGGFVDIVLDKITGFLVDFENVDQMNNKINYLLSNRAIQDKMGNNAKILMEKYNFSEYICFLIKLFDE